MRRPPVTNGRGMPRPYSPENVLRMTRETNMQRPAHEIKELIRSYAMQQSSDWGGAQDFTLDQVASFLNASPAEVEPLLLELVAGGEIERRGEDSQGRTLYRLIADKGKSTDWF
jgi:hypothetical protein